MSVEGTSDLSPSLAEVLLAILGEQDRERRLLSEGAGNLVGGEGLNLPL